LEIVILLDQRMLTPTEAGTLLGVSPSQTYKLLEKYRKLGAAALTSKKRGKRSNRAYPKQFKRRVLDLIEAGYRDFGPTLLAETLLEFHDVKLSPETLRQWMLQSGLWLTKRADRKRLHQLRRRMPCYGDLVQIDGSHHDWFEGRAPECTLMVYVDDATGKLQELCFFPQENRCAYFTTAQRYILVHGRPLRFLTDKHSGVWKAEGQSDFSKALGQLNVVHSFAHSPQSKGRVERVHRTLQDRLVKAMRLAAISTIEAANAFLPSFVEKYNRDFARQPAAPENTHSPVENRDEIESAFASKYVRRLSRQMGFSFQGAQYIILPDSLVGQRVGPEIIMELRLDGSMIVWSGTNRLNFCQI
jgi:transposase